MTPIDRIVFGDNQFFGINHMSQDKAQALAERFYDINNIFSVYEMVFDAGVKAVMLNSNDRANEICHHFRGRGGKYNDLLWYPSIPYPHKYANAVSEKGLVGAISDALIKGNTTLGAISILAKGGGALVARDILKLMQMLIDVEMKMFRGLNVRVVFLQNVLTDLMLGLMAKDLFRAFCDYLRVRYNALPGLITQNMPMLMESLKNWGITDVVICTSFNKMGYLMSPNVQRYMEAAAANDQNSYQIMAMSTLASGALGASEAYEFIKEQNIQSVVFGASSKAHIEETVRILQGLYS